MRSTSRSRPAALAIRECVRLTAARKLALSEPILDVGCGDGLFARLAYAGKQTWGIDINPSEVQRAQATAAYNTLVCGNICKVDLPKGFFGSAIANCSLEHVPDLDAALQNIGSALKPGASFALIVPTPTWQQDLATNELLRGVGMLGLAQAYARGLDNVFAHIHLYDEDEWIARLERNGYTDVTVEKIFNRAESWAFDLMLYPSLIAYFTKKLTGRWILAPALRYLTVDAARLLVQSLAKLAPAGGGFGEYLIVCKKR